MLTGLNRAQSHLVSKSGEVLSSKVEMERQVVTEEMLYAGFICTFWQVSGYSGDGQTSMTIWLQHYFFLLKHECAVASGVSRFKATCPLIFD